MTTGEQHRQRVQAKRKQQQRCKDMYKRMLSNAPEWVIEMAKLEMAAYNHKRNAGRGQYKRYVYVNSNCGWALTHSTHREEFYRDADEHYEYERMYKRQERWNEYEDNHNIDRWQRMERHIDF
jgi:hypothetical protein